MNFKERIKQLIKEIEGIQGIPLDLEEIKKMENVLNVSFPNEYREFLQTFGYLNIFGRKILGNGNPEFSTIKATFELRKFFPKFFPKDFIVIKISDPFLDRYPFTCLSCGKEYFGKMISWDPNPDLFPRFFYNGKEPDFWRWLLEELELAKKEKNEIDSYEKIYYPPWMLLHYWKMQGKETFITVSEKGHKELDKKLSGFLLPLSKEKRILLQIQRKKYWAQWPRDYLGEEWLKIFKKTFDNEYKKEFEKKIEKNSKRIEKEIEILGMFHKKEIKQIWELIKERKIDFGNPVNFEQINAWEFKLGIRLPLAYKQFLHLFGHLEIFPTPILGDGNGDFSFLLVTLYLRKMYPNKFLKELVAIKSDGGGNYYCINCGRKSYGEIIFWQHDVSPVEIYPNHPSNENSDFWMEAPNFWTWLLEFLRRLES